MIERNLNFSKLKPSYLFPEVSKRVALFKEKNPDADLISLSIGDTTEPIPKEITLGIKKSSAKLSTRKGYKGYGPEQGDYELRTLISKVIYKERVQPDEIFVSDGAKCDIGRLQLLFGPNRKVALQDPTYPVYLDTSLVMGQEIFFLPCIPEKGFLPDLQAFPKVDLLYFCSPNNPTGAVPSKSYLEELVKIAKRNKSILIFDAAYSSYIQDPSVPSSIFEIEGAKEVAIEVSSFSKLIGFTGIRLSWTVVPKTLYYKDGRKVYEDWQRIVTTFFNGASILAQAGGRYTLASGYETIQNYSRHYLENATLLKTALLEKSVSVYGGQNAPYLWIFLGKRKSWESFQILLEDSHIISTPGSGFGLLGEGYLRFTSFGSRSYILKAVRRIRERWPQNF